MTREPWRQEGEQPFTLCQPSDTERDGGTVLLLFRAALPTSVKPFWKLPIRHSWVSKRVRTLLCWHKILHCPAGASLSGLLKPSMSPGADRKHTIPSFLTLPDAVFCLFCQGTWRTGATSKRGFRAYKQTLQKLENTPFIVDAIDVSSIVFIYTPWQGKQVWSFAS